MRDRLIHHRLIHQPIWWPKRHAITYASVEPLPNCGAVLLTICLPASDKAERFLLEPNAAKVLGHWLSKIAFDLDDSPIGLEGGKVTYRIPAEDKGDEDEDKDDEEDEDDEDDEDEDLDDIAHIIH